MLSRSVETTWGDVFKGTMEQPVLHEAIRYGLGLKLMCKNCPHIMVFPGYLLFHLIVSKLFPLQNLALSLS